MLKKTITYKDLDGNPVTEDFYFNLSKSEITKMELAKGEGGLSGHLKRVVASNDGAAIMATFEDILSKAYGLRGADNKQFEKSPEISKKFMQTGAYDELFMELVTDADASSLFIRSIVPVDLTEGLENTDLPVELKSVQHDKPEGTFYSKQPVDEEIANMSHEQLVEALKKRKTAELQKDTVQDQ